MKSAFLLASSSGRYPKPMRQSPHPHVQVPCGEVWKKLASRLESKLNQGKSLQTALVREKPQEITECPQQLREFQALCRIYPYPAACPSRVTRRGRLAETTKTRTSQPLSQDGPRFCGCSLGLLNLFIIARAPVELNVRRHAAVVACPDRRHRQDDT